MLSLKTIKFNKVEQEQAGVAEDLYFIINPVAQNKGSLKIWQQIEKQLLANNIAYHSFYTEYKGHAKQIASEILSKTDKDTIIAAVGGDGTLHEVMNGAAGYPHGIIASIPAGSGNDYARGIQRTKGYMAALSLILNSSPKKIRCVDIGYLETNETQAAFINSFGIGIDAEITYEVNHSAWKSRFNALKLGKLVYIYFFLKKLLTYKRTDMTVVIDGTEHVFKKVWFIVTANQSYFGGGINISPHSEYDDGRFNLIAVHDIPHVKLLLVFMTVFWGGHLRLKNVTSFVCREVEITSKSPVKIQADGEIVGDSRVQAKMLMKKIRIFAKES
ncbi:Putative lipid kinase YtlR [Bacillus sp. CECT 9360]|nr:Putative lipid kinase YtlR [Bacillus sp. CECT 9360]